MFGLPVFDVLGSCSHPVGVILQVADADVALPAQYGSKLPVSVVVVKTQLRFWLCQAANCTPIGADAIVLF
jgi:hypothetical protein